MKTTLALFLSIICVTFSLAQNKIGVNTITPGSTLSVNGNTSLGQNYSQIAAPSNGLIVEGAVGVGTSNPTVGVKLEVNGLVKITGGNPAAGKVLTSDGTGAASWQSAAASAGVYADFYALMGPDNTATIGIGIPMSVQTLSQTGHTIMMQVRFQVLICCFLLRKTEIRIWEQYLLLQVY